MASTSMTLRLALFADFRREFWCPLRRVCRPRLAGQLRRGPVGLACPRQKFEKSIEITGQPRDCTWHRVHSRVHLPCQTCQFR